MMLRWFLLTLALIATPAAAVHDQPLTTAHRTCWADSFGTYEAVFRPDPTFPHVFTVQGIHTYADGSFKAPVYGSGFRYASGTVGFSVHLFAHGLAIDILANFYHTLAAGRVHYYYYHDDQTIYFWEDVWPVVCP